MVRAPCCEKMGLKKGRWTAEEDEILTNYIQAHGEGSWRSLPKNAGKFNYLLIKYLSTSSLFILLSYIVHTMLVCFSPFFEHDMLQIFIYKPTIHS